MSLESDGERYIERGKQKNSEKNLSQCHFDPGLRGERPATNDLSHGTALTAVLIRIVVKYMYISDLFQRPI
jgi:hypothetical protein